MFGRLAHLARLAAVTEACVLTIVLVREISGETTQCNVVFWPGMTLFNGPTVTQSITRLNVYADRCNNEHPHSINSFFFQFGTICNIYLSLTLLTNKLM